MGLLLLQLLFLGSVLGLYPSPRPREQPQLLEEGRQQLRKVQELTRLPGYGRCWSEALAKAERGCRELDQEEHSKIALYFTHCHLERSGKSFPSCPEGSTILACTEGMDSMAFGAYTEFFTHAHSICYYLQSEQWQQQAEDTMDRLTATSGSVARRLEATNQMAREMMEVQNATLAAQEEILRSGDTLKMTLQQSTQGVQQVFREMQDSTQEQQRVFAEIFRRLSYLHQFVMIESATFSSLTYNLLAMLVAFLVTATQRTASARLVLFLLISLSVYLERTVYSSGMDPAKSSYEHTERVYSRIWLLRRLVALAGLLALAYSAATYQDVARQSLELLHSVRDSQSQLQRMIEEAVPLLSPPRRLWQGGRLIEVEQDSGIGDLKTPNKECLPSGAAPSSEEPAAPLTSTPKKGSPGPRSPSRSAARRRSSRRSEVSVYNILVPESPSKYNLRRRKPSRDSAS
ncbi:uncharacterized protein LOC121272821 [Carcharodon carcharias]|uniref:uncharacterized protein LOC121272821 n=1 Tax=Carcharodon carcharias TaxID=13397 RepID=UPI001B7DB7A5|nr:uncharacterized protein LOC121272821 [Carcharodon carcharias]